MNPAKEPNQLPFIAEHNQSIWRSTNSSRVKQCHASPYPSHPTLTEVPPAGLKIILMQRQSYPISDMISPMSHQGRLSDSRPLRRRSALDSHDMITALRGKRLPRKKEGTNGSNSTRGTLRREGVIA